MSFEYSPILLPLLAAATISLFVAVFIWPRRHAPGANFLALIATALTPWALGYALEIAAINLETKIFWGKSQYLSIVFAPYFWLLFALAYTHQNQPRLNNVLRWLALLPATTLILIFTTEWHGLVWSDMFIKDVGNFSVLGVTYGPWFWIHFASSYLFLLAGTVILLRALWHMQGLYRAQIIAVLTAIFSPWIGNILYFTRLSPVPDLDLTPFAFTISVVALAWGIFGYRLGDILPIARDLVIDAMRDGMIVLDTRGRVADINNAASRMIGVPVHQAIGKSGVDLFQLWPHLLEHLQGELEVTDTITIGDGNAQRQYELTISILHDTQKTPLGRVITLHEAHTLSTPPPRFAARPLQPALSPSLPEPATGIRHQPILNAIFNFFIVPIKTDLPIPPDVNPTWVQTLERAFSIILRIAALLATIAILFTLPYMQAVPTVTLTFSVVIGLVWFLALGRTLPFSYRTTIFGFLLYILAIAETAGFGFSAESFTFFFTFVIMSTLLTELRGGMFAFFIALVTMGIFGWQIGEGHYVPTANDGGSVMPGTVQAAITSLLAFSASTAATIVATNILLRSLNRAWQLETQALNLLGQERDLLEQRIAERTQDLAEAHDQAIKSSLELQKYFLAIEQSGNAIFITDPAGNIEYVNPKFEELTGYPIAEARGHNPRLLKSGVQSPDFYRDLWQTIRSGQIWQGEMHNRRKDGSLYWQSATIAPVLDEAGQVTNFVAINEDITAQKQLQEQLQRQNEYLSILHQITIDLLNRRDLDKLLPAIVNGACFLLDAPLGEFMLKEGDYMVVHAHTKSHDYLAGDRVDRQTAKLSWQAHDTRQPAVLENYSAWAERRDIYDATPLQAVADFPVMVGDDCIGVLALGRMREAYPFNQDEIETGTLFARLAALVLDNANLYDSALKEIEERKRAEQSLQLINQEQQVLTNILQLSLEHRPLDDLLAVILKEILSISWLNLLAQGGIFLTEGPQKQLMLKVHHNLAPQIQTLCHQVALGQCLCGRAAATRQIQFSQHVNAHHEIAYEQMEDHGHYNIPILSGENVLGVIVLYLPPGYQAQESNIKFLQTVSNTLAGILERKRAEDRLAIARDQALQASRFKSQLLAKVSHELRTPLGVILGYTELLQDETFGPLSQRQKRIAGEVIDSTEFLSSLVGELLDEAQFEANTTQLHLEPFALRVWLEQVEAKMVILAQRKGLKFSVTLDPTLPAMLYGDERRLQQMLINLTGNAIKFTNTGEVRVRISRPHLDHWAIEVSDTGPGIPEEAQTYIFEPFRQVDGSITREHRGTGLGLSIVKQLAELMNGRVELHSIVGEGSTFTIWLPLEIESVGSSL